MPEIDKAGGASPATEQAEERTRETRDLTRETRAATDHLVIDCRKTFANGAVGEVYLTR